MNHFMNIFNKRIKFGYILLTTVILFIIAFVTLLIIKNINNQDKKSSQNTEVENRILFVPSERNYDNIQFADFRKDFDIRFNELVDELSDCYYNHWKYGESKAFQDYDVQPTREESKKLFDTLQALIWYWYDVEFDRQNKLQSPDKQIAEEQYNYVYNTDGSLNHKKSEKAQAQINILTADGFEINIYNKPADDK